MLAQPTITYGPIIAFNIRILLWLTRLNIFNTNTVLIILGLSDKLWKNNRYVYPLVIGGTGVISVIYACDEAGLSLGFITSLCQKLPLYSMGFCWVSVSLVMLVISLAIGFIKSRKKPKKA